MLAANLIAPQQSAALMIDCVRASSHDGPSRHGRKLDGEGSVSEALMPRRRSLRAGDGRTGVTSDTIVEQVVPRDPRLPHL